MSRRLNEKKVFNGVIFDVYQYDVEIRNKLYKREVVLNSGGVGVLAIKDHKVLLVKQYRIAVDEDILEIPAGKVEINEDPYVCGLRELEEESGYTTNQLEKICTMFATPGFCGENIHIYQATNLTPLPNPKAMDEDEEIELLWIDLDECMNMIQEGKIKDSKTIIALQHAYIKQNIG